MIKMSDYDKEDGTTDWVAYNKAQVNAGEKCMTCGTLMMVLSLFGNTPKNYARECGNCKALKEDKDPVSHSDRVRCPKCKYVREVDWEDGIHEDGEHGLTCEECDTDFTIQTTISFSFESPALIEETEEELVEEDAC